MKVNSIGNANQVHAGQRIIIPTYIYSRELPVSAPDNNPKTRAARASRGMIGEVQQSNIIVPTRAPTQILWQLLLIKLSKLPAVLQLAHIILL